MQMIIHSMYRDLQNTKITISQLQEHIRRHTKGSNLNNMHKIIVS